MTAFAQRLRELREYHGFTQAEVAHCVNLSSAAIGNYERGAREPGIRELIILSKFFGVSIDYLVGKKALNRNGKKTKTVRYAIIETLTVPQSFEAKEIDMIIHSLANGKECFWNEQQERL